MSSPSSVAFVRTDVNGIRCAFPREHPGHSVVGGWESSKSMPTNTLPYIFFKDLRIYIVPGGKLNGNTEVIALKLLAKGEQSNEKDEKKKLERN
jgi:hypothetical protein